MEIRLIPILLLKNEILYKGVNFKNHKYVGDPINAVKIFNEKEVDELIFLDIIASKENKEPNYEFLTNVASQCFMPLCYGGGIQSLHQIERILYSGVEKVSINSSAVYNKELIREAVKEFGSSTIVISIDAKKRHLGGYRVLTHSGSKKTKLNPLILAKEMDDIGVGEILINSIDQDGLMMGYDIGLIESISNAVSVPVIAAGGAGKMEHFKHVIKQGKASAIAAGSFFVFQGKHKAVLITYPDKTSFDFS